MKFSVRTAMEEFCKYYGIRHEEESWNKAHLFVKGDRRVRISYTDYTEALHNSGTIPELANFLLDKLVYLVESPGTAGMGNPADSAKRMLQQHSVLQGKNMKIADLEIATRKL